MAATTLPAQPGIQGNGPETPVQLAAPSGIGDLSLDPDAIQGTHFTGPVLSGPNDQVWGIAPLFKRAKFTVSNGSFNIPILLPNSAIPLAVYTQIEQSFNGTTPTLQYEASQGGALMIGAAIDLSQTPRLVTTPITGVITSSWTIWMHVTLTAATLGKATVMLLYSVPAKALPS